MSLSESEDAGQGGGFHGDGFPQPFNFSTPPPHHPGPDSHRRPNNTVSVTSYITISSSTISTLSTTSYVSTTRSTIVTSTLPVTVVPTASLAAQESALKSTASLTRTNTIIAGVLGGFIILLIIALALLFLLWILRRRREREDESPPLTSLATHPPSQFGVAAPTTQSAPQLPRQTFATSLSMGPRSAGFVPQSFASHPPNRSSFSRPFSAPGSTPVPGTPSPPPNLPAFQALPAINIQPNTPSVSARDDPSPISPILQPSAARMPLYHEALQQEAEAARNRAEAENAGRLGLPVIERAPAHRGSVRASVSSIGTDMGFENGSGDEHHREREGQPVLHSTRASSGVFPEP